MRGEALYHDPKKGNEARAALEAAADLFKRVAPEDSRYPGALRDLGSLALDRSDFAASADYYRQVLAVAALNRNLTGDTLEANQGLALALNYEGDVEGAAAAFQRATYIAVHTYGVKSRKYWMVASDQAEFLYERGERHAAFATFDTLIQSLPKEKTGFRNADDALGAALVLRKFGRCLATDGQGERSIELLERAQALADRSAMYPRDSAMLQIDLGSAYQAGGRIAEASDAFQGAIRILEAQQAPGSWLASAHERLGRLRLAEGNSD